MDFPRQKKYDMFKKGSTLLLKSTLVFMGLAGLAIAVFGFPNLYREAITGFPFAQKPVTGITILLYALTLPYFFVLWQSWKLLVLIDRNNGFSTDSVQAFKNIKYASLISGSLCMMGILPLLFPIADGDDAPGLLVYGFLFACVPFVVSVFAAVLEKLFQNALDLKSENELTI